MPTINGEPTISPVISRGTLRSPMSTRTLYRLTPKSFEMKKVYELGKNGKPAAKFDRVVSDRVGHYWAKGRLKPGDIVLCDRLAGDCFYDFYLVDFTKYENRQGVHMCLVMHPFGAYAMNAEELVGLTENDYFRLRAGEEVEVMVKLT